MMWVYSSSSQHRPKEKQKGEKMEERNGGGKNKRKITEKKETNANKENKNILIVGPSIL
jgi:hypothetical protein